MTSGVSGVSFPSLPGLDVAVGNGESRGGIFRRSMLARFMRKLQASDPVLTAFVPQRQVAVTFAAGKPECRFRCQLLKDRLLHLAIRCRVDAVRASVAPWGRVDVAFSQSEQPFVREILRHRETAGGVCESLAAHWIEAHSRGTSLWQELYRGENRAPPHPEYLVSVKRLQAVGIRPEEDQDETTDVWLTLHGVLPRPISGRYDPREPFGVRAGGCNQIDGVTEGEGPRHLLDAMLDRRGMASIYKKVQLQGRFCAHTLAAFVDDGVRFFDPNFGEFHFDDTLAFRAWFANEFWPRSLYGLGVGLGQFFVVSDYERRMMP